MVDSWVATLPAAAQFIVEPEAASRLFACAEALPLFENQAFYSNELQQLVHDEIRTTGGAAFEDLIDEIRLRLSRSPYSVLVRGLSFDQGNRLFVGINRSFGDLVALPFRKPRAQLVHYIQPATDLPSPRGGRESEVMHTDTTDWDPPVDYVAMTCVRPDPAGGGRTRLLDIDSFISDLRSNLGEDAIQQLQSEHVPWKLAECFNSEIRWRPVLSEGRMIWRKLSIDQALLSDETSMSAEMSSLLSSVERIANSSSHIIEFLMQKGDLFLSSNLKTLHARTAINSGTQSDRLMIRAWVKSQTRGDGCNLHN